MTEHKIAGKNRVKFVLKTIRNTLIILGIFLGIAALACGGDEVYDGNPVLMLKFIALLVLDIFICKAIKCRL